MIIIDNIYMYTFSELFTILSLRKYHVSRLCSTCKFFIATLPAFKHTWNEIYHAILYNILIT